MQPIQDKDFDQLFKNAFEDAEIAPAKGLWGSIESKIEPKSKRIIPIYWLSAAAVLLIATASVLIYQQQDVKPKQFANHITPKVAKPAIEKLPVTDTAKAVITPAEKIERVLPEASKPVEMIAKSSEKEKTAPAGIQKPITSPEITKRETLMAKTETPQKDLKTKIEEAILKPQEEVILAANTSTILPDEVAGENDQPEKRGIRNVGDVVNLIVNKMDKRKDKLIQFRTDDDDSSISAVNIGPFRIGKKNRK